jgi:hypothetical protein
LARLDTIVVPAHPGAVDLVLVRERRWPNLKIDQSRIDNIKYIAVYQTNPISAITHYAEIDTFQTLERAGRFDAILKGEPVVLTPVRFTRDDACAVQRPRYTMLELVLSAKNLTRAFPT